MLRRQNRRGRDIAPTPVFLYLIARQRETVTV